MTEITVVPEADVRRIVEYWAGVGWPVPQQAVPGLIGNLGWTMDSDESEFFDTDFAVNDPGGAAFSERGFLHSVVFKLTDLFKEPTAQSTELYGRAWVVYRDTLAELLGEPTMIVEDILDRDEVAVWRTKRESQIRLPNSPYSITIEVLSPHAAFGLEP